ncbi:MAG: signal peptidase II [Candidatus Komeilibacteria bacterium]
MNKKYLSLLILLCLFIIERIAKFLALKYAFQGYFCCQNWLGIKLLYNPGIAFGLPIPTLISLIISSLIIILLIIAIIKNFHKKPFLTLPLGLIVIGASSNLIDRIKYQQIIDFLHLGPWPVFNLADSFIVLGALLLIWHQLKKS